MNHDTDQTRFALAISDGLRKALSQTGRAAWHSQTEPAPLHRGANLVAISLTMRGDLNGEALLGITAPELSALLAPGDSEAGADGFLSMLRLAEPHIRGELTRACGAVTLEFNVAPTIPATAIPISRISLRGNEQGRASLILFAGPELHSTLTSGEHHLAAPSHDDTRDAMAPRSGHIDRVIDVSLAVKLRFGQRQITLRELLDLNTGSLVELNREIEDPVELMLGDRVIALGEVVIVDGNYGLRVTEVVDAPLRATVR